MRVLIFAILFFQICYASNLKGIILSKDKKCRETFQLYVTHGKSVVYQLEVPHGGSFEFDLPKNKYRLTAVNESGCSYEADMEITKNQVFKEIWVKK